MRLRFWLSGELGHPNGEHRRMNSWQPGGRHIKPSKMYRPPGLKTNGNPRPVADATGTDMPPSGLCDPTPLER